ncbi:Hypothetical protein GbCGDNIH9_0043 [Granulibacter bethesdensis]|uniref:Uncharacterized protein n=2 Tax=Granulibacter bethesdensis TaxID=364410 RepID=A0AAC9KC75_9PROT|nr:Hypothetical protein GbCGDNIH9_0043 [Granulibacter bethesdensis]APH60840.1 Hypothetical protein GbCGDNIH8_0043 [Granulibacter bethesdensis]
MKGCGLMRPDKQDEQAVEAGTEEHAPGPGKAGQVCGRLAQVDPALRAGHELPMVEHALLWTMRAWAIGVSRRVNTSAAIQEVYQRLGIPAAALHLDGFMWALCRGARRQLDVNCVCQTVVSQDEALLLDVLALAQEQRYEAMTVLSGMTKPEAAIAGCESAGQLMHLLNKVGHVMPRASAALRRHAFGTMEEGMSTALH